LIRVLIVDDHAVVRQGLRFLLEQQADIEIAGEAADGDEAVEAVRDQVPAVVLLDLLMPKSDGLTALREIKQVSPATQVVILTSLYDDAHLFDAIKAGAISYVHKTAGVDAVVGSVRAAARGESVLDPGVASKVLEEMRRSSAPNATDQLSKREIDVLTALARGRSNKEIAKDLSIGEETVKTHISNILSKLQLADRTQAAIYALQRRLVPLDKALDSTP
jgi:NarL family two-component system response regulator LiaR